MTAIRTAAEGAYRADARGDRAGGARHSRRYHARRDGVERVCSLVLLGSRLVLLAILAGVDPTPWMRSPSSSEHSPSASSARAGALPALRRAAASDTGQRPAPARHGRGPFRVWECRPASLGQFPWKSSTATTASYFESFYEHELAPTPAARAAALCLSGSRARGVQPSPFAPVGPPGRVLDVAAGGRCSRTIARSAAALRIEVSEALRRCARTGCNRPLGHACGSAMEPRLRSRRLLALARAHSWSRSRRCAAPASFPWRPRNAGYPRPELALLAALRAAELLVPLDLPRHVNHFSRARFARGPGLDSRRKQSGRARHNRRQLQPSLPDRPTLDARLELWLPTRSGSRCTRPVLALDRLLGGDACYAILRRAVNTL